MLSSPAACSVECAATLSPQPCWCRPVRCICRFILIPHSKACCSPELPHHFLKHSRLWGHIIHYNTALNIFPPKCFICLKSFSVSHHLEHRIQIPWHGVYTAFGVLVGVSLTASLTSAACHSPAVGTRARPLPTPPLLPPLSLSPPLPTPHHLSSACPFLLGAPSSALTLQSNVTSSRPCFSFSSSHLVVSFFPFPVPSMVPSISTVCVGLSLP
uniref:Uncharacterized protein n=1 Tax=Pipistrellus kuhlii TaxID=59472 RepID=A0A7J7TW37_PIPKU|nr:hypothetical protein mPipKuh1_009250 [Pipistrellus kuhlii]